MQDPGWLGKRDGQPPAVCFYPQPSLTDTPDASGMVHSRLGVFS